MKKKMKRAKEAKTRWEQETRDKVKSFVRKLSLQWKIRERIDAANAWAVKHPKHTLALLGDSRFPLFSTVQQGYCGRDRECAAYVRRTAEHTEWQEHTGSGGRTAGPQRSATERGVGFFGAYSYQDASGFCAYHL